MAVSTEHHYSSVRSDQQVISEDTHVDGEEVIRGMLLPLCACSFIIISGVESHDSDARIKSTRTG